MGIFSIFKRKTENRSIDQTEPTASLIALLGTTGTLTRAAALEIPSVSANINKLANTISQLPVRLYVKSDGKVREITDDPRIKLLNGETGDTLDTVEMWRMSLEDYFLGSGAWIYIDSQLGKARGLHYVDNSRISFMQNNDPIFKSYDVLVNGQRYYDFKFLRLLRKTRDGFTNIPLQEENQKIFSAAWNALKLEAYLNGNGGAKPGVLSSETRLSTEAIEALKQGYQNVMSNQDFDAPKALVLNNGVKYTPMTSSSTEMQLNENKKTNSIEISKLFGYPHTIIDGGASEEDKKQFTAAVISLLNYIETELDKRLLLESEKEQGYYWAFDTKEMTRGSQLERYQAYDIALKNHFLQVDEVREAEDYDAMGFNWLTMGLGDILLNPDTMEVFTPNTGQTSNLGDLSTEQRGNDKHDPKSGRFALKNSSGSVDKSAKGGIIKAEEGLNRKLNPDKIEPMPRKQLRKITKSFSKQGGVVQMNSETDYYLNKRKAEAITYNSKTILLKQKPGRAAVFEELIHTAQYREGKMNGSTLSRIECEIEAQKKLLKYSMAYKLTTKEIEQTRAALKDYEEELKEYHRNGGT